MAADPGPLAGDPDDEQRHLRRLVSSLRARGGVEAVGAACHHDVPAVDGVILTVDAAHAGRIVLSDSGPDGDQLDDLHATLGEGPGIDAVATREPVAAADLGLASAQARWPRFAEQAPARGIRAVFAVPVLLRERPIGVLAAYRTAPGPLSKTDQRQLHRYAEAVPPLLVGDPRATADGLLDFVLPVRAGQVQQAIGIVMEFAGVDAATALHRMRAYARHSARPLPDVVADVRTCRLPFDPTAAT